MSEPRFSIIAGDVIDAMQIGQAVQEGELDAEVRQHPYLKPGEALLIDRERLRDIVPASWSVVGD